MLNMILIDVFIKAITFTVLMVKMKGYGNYLFRKISNKMYLYFALDTTVYSFFIIVNYSTANKFMLVGYLISFATMVMVAAVLYLKSTQDMLCELSKLDYILIVSIF